MLLRMAWFHSFLWLSNNPLYICTTSSLSIPWNLLFSSLRLFWNQLQPNYSMIIIACVCVCVCVCVYLCVCVCVNEQCYVPFPVLPQSHFPLGNECFCSRVSIQIVPMLAEIGLLFIALRMKRYFIKLPLVLINDMNSLYL